MLGILKFAYKVRMKKYRLYRAEVGKIANNLLECDFSAKIPNGELVTDITKSHMLDQKPYLTPISD